jgi:hypothetical protein
MCDDVQLCYRGVCEFLILERTWFVFGLPSKTGLGSYSVSLLKPGVTAGPHKKWTPRPHMGSVLDYILSFSTMSRMSKTGSICGLGVYFCED